MLRVRSPLIGYLWFVLILGGPVLVVVGICRSVGRNTGILASLSYILLGIIYFLVALAMALG
jgi:hypothetical protein